MTGIPASRAARRIQAEAVRRPLPPRRRRFVGPIATFATMLTVAAMTVVTSVPANALLTADDLQQGNLGTVQARGSQTLTSAGAQAADATISRDSYAVTDAEENALASRFGNVGTFTNNPDAPIQWPFAVGVPISSGYGYRPDQPAGAKPFHEGTDFNPGAGAPIQSIAAGVVRQVVESDSGLGVHVVIEHEIDGQTMTSTYAHMQFGSVAVSEGQTIDVGDRIGLVGSTGQATGPHLHLEIHMADGTAVDPYLWLVAHAG
ncbi:M23 family metallopeptidase [Amnibacterium flavum]|uniref:M23ase beta-sheet core domain-containing protein n=1 Tax=Amnibacterium flavum TaxID=2173173 RepID=A0A2V1HY16_9MICO|nr:M23 family metallopeptidase [Amnibacterium flavum]PVZ95617.1 hypothetical protein DDQ50_03770 [Amnibacterium flavum]